jgi:hypothetical protein
MKFLYLVFGLLAATLNPTAAFAGTAPSSAESVTQFGAQLSLGRDGLFDILENITYDFGQAAPHTITHQIPLSYSDDQGNPLDSKFVFIDAKLDGKPLNLKPAVSGGRADFALPAGSGPGPHHYALHYTLKPVILKGPDADILKYSVTGLAWSVPIAHTSVTLNTPDHKPENLTCYTGSSGVTTSNCRITDNGRTSTVVTDATLSPGDSLGIHAGFPRHSFTSYYNGWQFTSLLPWAYGILGLLVLLIIGLIYRRQKRRPRQEPPTDSN